MNTITYGKYRAEIYERDNLQKYPNHKFAVKYIQDTPKGKYSSFKVLNHFVYKDITEANNAAETWINTIKTNIESDTKRKEEIKQRDKEVKAADYYKIDDIIVNTWGWEQTNVEFYKVIAMTEKTITIQELMQYVVPDSSYQHGMACEVMPKPNEFLKNGDTYTLKVKHDGCLSNPKSFYYMRKWSGKPQYNSWYA